MASVTYEHVTKRFGDMAAVADLMLEIGDGEFMVLVGPSGCGKRTALRMLAGLERSPKGGSSSATASSTTLRHSTGHRNGIPVVRPVSAHDRLQQPGVRSRNQKVPKRDIDRRIQRAAEILDLDPLIKRRPNQLSGGQRQRVALGRAIVREPAAFLMDEPLSNLDAKLRVQTHTEIPKLQQNLGTTTIYITDDQVEAMTMGDRIAVMNLGVLQQVELAGRVVHESAEHLCGRFHRLASDNLVPAPLLDGVGGQNRIAGFRPEHINLGNGRTEAIPFTARVEVVEYSGDDQLVHMTCKDTALEDQAAGRGQGRHRARR